ncbi:MAG: 50S ribosomal protein L3 N(5)-glutamine methyltransferase [Bradyrhizobium sp.]
MARRAKPVARRARKSSGLPRVAAGELRTLLDFVRYATSRFVEAKLVLAHGTSDPVAEAAFLVCETLHLHPDQFESFATARVTGTEAKAILEIIERRVATRKPAAYLVNKIYMRGLPFYVDARTVVPRSFIGELLDSHFGGQDNQDGDSLIADPTSVETVLDLCTGSGCLAVLASRRFPNARVDAVDISGDALDVAARNIADYGLQQQVTLHRGDLFHPIGGQRYDLIISNPPYVDAAGMAALPRECRAEPRLAFDGGADGLDIIRRILKDARRHLTSKGGLLCEIGRCRPALEAAFPHTGFLWLDTEESDGEVFWIDASDL